MDARGNRGLSVNGASSRVSQDRSGPFNGAERGWLCE